MTQLFVTNDVLVNPERAVLCISLFKILMTFVSLFRPVTTDTCIAFRSSLSCSFPAYRVSVLIS